MRELHLEFEYNLPNKVVHKWWTDLSGTGYVGKALKSVTPVGKEGEKILVETKWRIMGMTMTLLERLSIHSQDHWTWQPHLLGIYITDEFRLTQTASGRVRLTIDSTITPRGMKGKMAYFLLGRKLDRMMIEEWESASKALVAEVSAAASGPPPPGLGRS